MNKTKIDWCDSTWNPVTGCLHGCEYCYARNIAHRFGGWNYAPGMLRINIADDKTYICPGKDYYGEVIETEYGIIADITDQFLGRRGRCAYPFGFTPTFHRYRLSDYIDRNGRNIFVCSMADLFGDWVPDSWIEEVFKACKKAPQHNYLFLTKNPDRYIKLELDKRLPWADNFWFGSTVTGPEMEYAWFMEKKFHWFLSIEPIMEDMGPLGKGAGRPEWIIVGAETGNRKGKVIPKKLWIENLLEECRKYNIPLFMKSSLAEIWGDPLIQELPRELQKT